MPPEEQPPSAAIWLPSSVDKTSRPSGEPGPLQRPRRAIASVGDAVNAGVDLIWGLLDRLPVLERRGKPLLAAVLGFLFGGLGLALYLRRSVDVIVGIVLLVPLSIAGSQLDTGQQGADESLPAWIWIFQALSALYSFLRVISSNRRLEAGEAAPA
jgi:hypothetical protein